MTDDVPSAPTEGWPSDWIRAALVPCVLHVLAGGPNYGYAIAADLRALGLGEVKGGTLYPLLARLEKRGLLRTRWSHESSGPGRKYFRLTARGEAQRARLAQEWQGFAATVGAFVAAPPTPPAQAPSEGAEQ